MQHNPLHMGPTFQYISKRDHQLHLQKMSQILRKPLPKVQSLPKPRKPFTPLRQQQITTQNHRIGQRLFEIWHRKKTQSPQSSHKQTQGIQKYMALLRRRRLEKIRLENLSLADRLTRRLAGGYSSTQREIEEMREHLKTEHVNNSRSDNKNTISLKLPKIIRQQ